MLQARCRCFIVEENLVLVLRMVVQHFEQVDQKAAVLGPVAD